MATVKLTDADFTKEVLEASQVVLVDFWAEWCGPCRALGPKLEEISNEMGSEKMKVMKLNVDENPEAPTRYGVRGIPTMIIFKDGKEVEQIVGNHPKDNIVAIINKYI